MLNRNSKRAAAQKREPQRIDHSYVMPKRRWYDYRPILFHALDLMTSVPNEVCSILAHEINGFAEQEYEADSVIDRPKNLGKDKVLALYKSKNRQRDIDQCESLHILLNYLFVLPEKQQYTLATQILGVSAIVHDYYNTCQVFDQKPSMDEIRRLSDLYFDTGMGGAKGALELIKAELRIAITQKHDIAEWLQEVGIEDNERDLKIEGEIQESG